MLDYSDRYRCWIEGGWWGPTFVLTTSVVCIDAEFSFEYRRNSDFIGSVCKSEIPSLNPIRVTDCLRDISRLKHSVPNGATREQSSQPALDEELIDK
jgi:hypothetical protein